MHQFLNNFLKIEYHIWYFLHYLDLNYNRESAVKDNIAVKDNKTHYNTAIENDMLQVL